MPAPDCVIGSYRLLELIGEGGMGEVWLAEQKYPVRRRVALKLIKRGMDSREVIARFESERQALALMDHPSIAKIYDAGTTDYGRPYFVMEFVPGVGICDYCDRHKLNVRERLDLFVKVCGGVQHAHRKAVIHRDLKPSNIMVCEVDGKPVPKIIDFGVAKAVAQQLSPGTVFTRAGVLLGTPEYMSPEQFQSAGEDIDTRSDVFSLGVILYELLSGETPIDYRKLALEEILRAIRLEDPKRPSARLRTATAAQASTIAMARRTELRALYRELHGDLDAIALKSLEKDRSRRYGSPSEFAADLTSYLANEPVVARPASFLYSAKKFFLRNTILALSGASLLALFVAFSVTEAIQLSRITQERDRSDRAMEFMIEMFRVPHHGFGPGLSITAEEILDKASKDAKSSYGMDPIMQARLESALGLIYHNLGGSNAQAEALVRDAVRIQTKAAGVADRGTLRLDRMLALVLRSNDANTQQRVESEQILRNTVKVDRRVLGAQDPETLKAVAALGLMTSRGAPEDSGKHDNRESETLLREALDGQRRVLGVRDPEARQTMFWLSRILAAHGRYGEAEGPARELADVAHLNSSNVDELKTALLGLGDILYQQKKYSEAEQVCRELSDLENRVPADVEDAGFPGKMFLAEILAEEGRYFEAEAVGRSVLDLERTTFGAKDARVGRTFYELACIAARSHQTDKALAFLRDALQHALPAAYVEDIRGDKQLEFIRGDARFAALLRSLQTASAGSHGQ